MITGLLIKRNIFFLNVILSILLLFAVFFLARDAMTLYFGQGKTIRTGSTLPADKEAGAKKTQFIEYSGILTNNPFGFAGGELKLLTGSATSQSQSSDIALIGTVVGPKELSFGVFRDKTGIQEVFKIGEQVFGVGKLSRVEKEKVMLRQSGKEIEIPLDDVKIKEISKPGIAGSPQLSAFAQRVGTGLYIVDQNKLQHAIANPGQMMTDARLKPNVANGKEEGFVLSEVKPGGIYHSLGLQDSDVLLRINEYDISNPERALQAFNALRGLDRVQIDMIRSGARMTMTYQIK
ncbi:MAG: type II secretion system protein N [Thermodesulfovibrionales bacterium]|nr:type II secretion system protein N [Thermodesulfovibrionales bacterium]